MAAPFRNCVVNPQKNPKLYEPNEQTKRRRDCDTAKNTSPHSGEFFGLRIFHKILGLSLRTEGM